MMLFNPLTLIVILVCAFFFFCAAKFEETSGFAWVGLSLLISVLIWRWTGGDVSFILLGQVALYVGITFFRARNKP